MPAFTLLCISVDELLCSETDFVMTLCDFLAVKWERLHNIEIGWVKAYLSFIILYAVLLYVHGNLTGWGSLRKWVMMWWVPLCQLGLLIDSSFCFLLFVLFCDVTCPCSRMMK